MDRDAIAHTKIKRLYPSSAQCALGEVLERSVFAKGLALVFPGLEGEPERGGGEHGRRAHARRSSDRQVLRRAPGDRHRPAPARPQRFWLWLMHERDFAEIQAAGAADDLVYDGVPLRDAGTPSEGVARALAHCAS